MQIILTSMNCITAKITFRKTTDGVAPKFAIEDIAVVYQRMREMVRLINDNFSRQRLMDVYAKFKDASQACRVEGMVCCSAVQKCIGMESIALFTSDIGTIPPPPPLQTRPFKVEDVARLPTPTDSVLERGFINWWYDFVGVVGIGFKNGVLCLLVLCKVSERILTRGGRYGNAIQNGQLPTRLPCYVGM